MEHGRNGHPGRVFKIMYELIRKIGIATLGVVVLESGPYVSPLLEELVKSPLPDVMKLILQVAISLSTLYLMFKKKPEKISTHSKTSMRDED